MIFDVGDEESDMMASAVALVVGVVDDGDGVVVDHGGRIVGVVWRGVVERRRKTKWMVGTIGAESGGNLGNHRPAHR